MERTKNYIYIMTNPGIPGLIKIGHAKDPEQRRKELSSSSGVPAEYEIYATAEVPSNLKDKKIHEIIQQLNPSLRFNPKREFFSMSPEDAYTLLYNIATIYAQEHLVIKKGENDNDCDSSAKRMPNFQFSMCNLKPGDLITYINDETILAEVCDDKHVKYKDKIWSLSALASELMFGEKKPIQGPLYFKYNGKTLSELRDINENNSTKQASK